jgi:hypothetical protein
MRRRGHEMEQNLAAVLADAPGGRSPPHAPGQRAVARQSHRRSQQVAWQKRVLCWMLYFFSSASRCLTSLSSSSVCCAIRSAFRASSSAQQTGPIRNQAAAIDHGSPEVNCGQSMPCRERRNQLAMRDYRCAPVTIRPLFGARANSAASCARRQFHAERRRHRTESSQIWQPRWIRRHPEGRPP